MLVQAWTFLNNRAQVGFACFPIWDWELKGFRTFPSDSTAALRGIKYDYAGPSWEMRSVK